MRLIALKPLPYKGRRLSVGDEFEVSCVKTQRVLVALGKAKAKIADDTEVMEFLDPEFPEQTTTTTEAPVTDKKPSKPKRKPRRKYKRRDLKVEDD